MKHISMPKCKEHDFEPTYLEVDRSKIEELDLKIGIWAIIAACQRDGCSVVRVENQSRSFIKGSDGKIPNQDHEIIVIDAPWAREMREKHHEIAELARKN